MRRSDDHLTRLARPEVVPMPVPSGAEWAAAGVRAPLRDGVTGTVR